MIADLISGMKFYDFEAKSKPTVIIRKNMDLTSIHILNKYQFCIVVGPTITVTVIVVSRTRIGSLEG